MGRWVIFLVNRLWRSASVGSTLS